MILILNLTKKVIIWIADLFQNIVYLHIKAVDIVKIEIVDR